MTTEQRVESLWADFEPDTLISETKIPDRANELATTVDDWFAGFIKYVDPFNWDEIKTEAFRKKGFLELSGYLLNAHGVTGDNPLPEIHDVIVNRVNDRQFPHLMLRSPRELHHFALPFIYAYAVDEFETKTARRLEKCIEADAFWEVERVPYRQIESWFLSKCFSEMVASGPQIYDVETALENSLLNHKPHVIRSTLSDAYCLTHDVFFYDNHLGIFPELFPEDPAPYDISDELFGLILRYMAENNCDIVLELVISGVLQRQISRGMVQFVLSWILEKVEKHGHVPGPETNKTVLMDLPEPGEGYVDQNVDETSDRWDYDNEQERVWGENFHVNAVAGMTARIVARDWEKLERGSKNMHLNERSNRRDIARLGQVLKSFAEYDLKKGARRLHAMTDSGVMNKYQPLVRESVTFLRDQQCLDGSFGYWTNEEMLYTNAGNSSDSFRNEFVEPITEACEAAIKAVESEIEQT